ncbi:hypothetical protein H4219_001011 [Mycoemilia scoparia]|uniref:HhH-GPD domain-containing protein n=1 Tax=Mycoemilia scoparia TaxID=417184 RepID=A0A9W8DWN5_9FUNG|nr:hypothetical protein H4219_001011 [Mycoemilia scoparia]
MLGPRRSPRILSKSKSLVSGSGAPKTSLLGNSSKAGALLKKAANKKKKDYSGASEASSNRSTISKGKTKSVAKNASKKSLASTTSTESNVTPNSNDDKETKLRKVVPVKYKVTKLANLNEGNFVAAAKEHLVRVDPKLGDFIRNCKVECRLTPSRGDSASCFEALAKSIIYQQLAGKAARAIYIKFLALFGLNPPPVPSATTDSSDNGTSSTSKNSGDGNWESEERIGFPSPAQVLTHTVETLRPAGLSVRKAEYILALASNFELGNLSDAKLLEMSDEEVSKSLTSIRGIGQWTVDMFLMFHLRRPNILPTLDLAVKKAMCQHFGVPFSKNSPKHDQLVELAKHWAPYRSIATWYMWQTQDTVTV